VGPRAPAKDYQRAVGRRSRGNRGHRPAFAAVFRVAGLQVDVPRAWLRRNCKGLWYSVRDIPADRIRRVLSFAELAGASAA
jgi:hypothetical protein